LDQLVLTAPEQMARVMIIVKMFSIQGVSKEGQEERVG
jgi:hypothetical protein